MDHPIIFALLLIVPVAFAQVTVKRNMIMVTSDASVVVLKPDRSSTGSSVIVETVTAENVTVDSHDANFNNGNTSTDSMGMGIPVETDSSNGTDSSNVTDSSVNVTAVPILAVTGVVMAKFGQPGNLVPVDQVPVLPPLRQNVSFPNDLPSNHSVVITDNRRIIINGTDFGTTPVIRGGTTQIVNGGTTFRRRVARAVETSTAFVSMNVDNVETNQTIGIGKNEPIIAILPPGSNFTATWNSSEGRPNITRVSAKNMNHQQNIHQQQVKNTHSNSNRVVPVVVKRTTILPAPQDVTVSLATVRPLNGAAVGSQAVMQNDIQNGTDGFAVVPLVIPVQRTVSNNNDSVVFVNNASSTTVAAIVASTTANSNIIIVQQNHRIEVAVTGYELRNADNTGAKPDNQNLQLWIRFTAGALSPALTVQEVKEHRDLTPIDASHPVLVDPVSTTGYSSAFNGSYTGNLSLSKNLAVDLCGQNPDKGILSVIGRATDNSNPVMFSCPLNIMIPTAARISEATWSNLQQCSTSLANGQSQILWYQVRNYNINFNQCQENPPNLG